MCIEVLDDIKCFWVDNMGSVVIEPSWSDEDIEEESFWLVADKRPYYCLAPNLRQKNEPVSNQQRCGYDQLWFFRNGSLRLLARPDLCLDMDMGCDYHAVKVKSCSHSEDSQLWDYDPSCRTLQNRQENWQKKCRPAFLVAADNSGNVAIVNSCLFSACWNSSTDYMTEYRQEEKKDGGYRQRIWHQIPWQNYRPQSRFTAFSPIRYPIALNNSEALQEEYIRDVINRARLKYSSSISPPYPRDIGHFPGHITEGMEAASWKGSSFNYTFEKGSNSQSAINTEYWLSTGLYAAAGKRIYVLLDSTASNNFAIRLHILVRLNTHSGLLEHSEPLIHWPA